MEMSTLQQHDKSKRARPGLRIVLVAVLLVLANALAWLFNGQIDLTKDKRFTITPATRQMLRKLPGKMEVLVFLNGDKLPAAFQSLSKSTEDVLRDFRDISGNKVVYRMVDPLGDDTAAIEILRSYRMSGIPVSIDAGKKGTEQKMVFPWALVTKIDAQGQLVGYPVFLQESNSLNLNRKTLLKSEMLLEYNLANGIHQLGKERLPRVAYALGNGQPFDLSVFSAISNLRRYYAVDTFNLGANESIPQGYDALIVHKPSIPFSEVEKFKIDQYVMHGGHVFWSLNMASGSLDSLRGGSFNSLPIELNLGDMLYNYGLRINTNLVLDAVNMAQIPIQASTSNATPDLMPWVYFPILGPATSHPIVNNLNGVLTTFVSSIDTNSNEQTVRKVPLLMSSKYSKVVPVPAPVMLKEALDPPNPASFGHKEAIAAVLLEGKFSSLYAQRWPQSVAHWVDSLHVAPLKQGPEQGKMIVVADADIIGNEVSAQSGPLEMGMMSYMQGQVFDNGSFFLNCLEYMTDPDNLLEARNKDFDTRVLDPKLVNAERQKWQWINIGVPVLSILVMAGCFFFYRKRKYG